MSRKVRRVPVILDAGEIRDLPVDGSMRPEIAAGQRFQNL